MQPSPSEDSARSKLKQKMKAERLKRSSADAQRSFLEKKKVPNELIDTCMNQLKHKANPTIQNVQMLLNTIQTLVKKDTKQETPQETPQEAKQE